MAFFSSHSNKPWYGILCTLLAFVMLIAPVVSAITDLHESEHVTLQDSHSDTSNLHDDHASPDQDDATDDSNFHFLAHASHCCGLIVALLPNMLRLVLMPVQSTPIISQEHSLTGVVKIPHFRPPIVL